jgi:hypothetical protein
MLTTLEKLKARLKIETADTADDTQLQAFCKLVSARFARECRRTFERSAVATHTFRADETQILPDRYPIESVSAWAVKGDEDTGWETQTNVDYLIGPAAASLELASPLGSSSEIARVTFAGGYVLPGATPGTGQTALPDDLEQACIEQTIYIWQNRNRLGLVSMSGEGGSIAQFAKLDLLPLVASTLAQHVRLTVF